MTMPLKQTSALLALRRVRWSAVVRRFWWPALWREIEQERAKVKDLCRDWAEDHTHLQKLCREVGCTEFEVEGDSYGVPGVMDLADQLRRRIPSNVPGQPHAPGSDYGAQK